MKVKPIISNNIRIRYPDCFTVGEGSVIDDFSYFSVKMSVGRFCHIGPSVSVIGGKEEDLVMEDYSCIVTGSRVICASDDWRFELNSCLPPDFPVKKGSIKGGVLFAKFATTGANSIIMPNNFIKEGVAIGAGSFVPADFDFKPWTIYVGAPIRPIRERDEIAVRKQAEQVEIYLNHLNGGVDGY